MPHFAMDRDPPRRPDGTSLATGRAGGEQPGGARQDGSETETVERDVLHQADYGGARDGSPLPDDAQQGGLATDKAAGGGREPTADRDRDYDPDGDRAGL